MLLTLIALITAPVAAQPPAPAGQVWQPIPELSDEFNTDALDTARWLPYHPYWQGRAPSRFDTANVSVGDGLLRLRALPLVDSVEQVANPQRDIWVHSSCVTSKEKYAEYGYYEARIKASDLSMTSSFWFQGDYSEIDAVEQIGRPLAHPQNNQYMLMNTHFYPSGWGDDRKTPERWRMPYAAAEDFHRYGIWWRDEATVLFYHNGEQVAEVKTGGAFDEPMYLFFDTEVFVWEGLPTIESLRDPTRNTMLVDWVRAWKLSPETNPSTVEDTAWAPIKRDTDAQ